MKITSKEDHEEGLYFQVQWTHGKRISFSEACSLIERIFPDCNYVHAFQSDGKAYDYDNGQSEGRALVWMI